MCARCTYFGLVRVIEEREEERMHRARTLSNTDCIIIKMRFETVCVWSDSEFRPARSAAKLSQRIHSQYKCSKCHLMDATMEHGSFRLNYDSASPQQMKIERNSFYKLSAKIFRRANMLVVFCGSVFLAFNCENGRRTAGMPGHMASQLIANICILYIHISFTFAVQRSLVTVQCDPFCHNFETFNFVLGEIHLGQHLLCATNTAPCVHTNIFYLHFWSFIVFRIVDKKRCSDAKIPFYLWKGTMCRTALLLCTYNL